MRQTSKMKRNSLFLLLLIVWTVLWVSPASAAVTISSFAAQRQPTQVLLRWTTASEVQNVGFNLYRSTSTGQRRDTKVNSSLIPTQCLGCVTGASYSLTDSGASAAQTYYYTLESVDASGGTQLHGPAAANAIAQPTATVVPPTNVPATSAAFPTAATGGGISTPSSNVVSAPATKTATRAPASATNTQSPGRAGAATFTPVPNSASGSSGPAPASTLPVRIAQAYRTATATPLPVAPVAQLVPTRAAPDPANAESLAAANPSSSEDGESLEEGNPEDGASATASRNVYLRRLVIVTSVGLAGLSGLGSLLSGTLALVLLLRASRRGRYESM